MAGKRWPITRLAGDAPEILRLAQKTIDSCGFFALLHRFKSLRLKLRCGGAIVTLQQVQRRLRIALRQFDMGRQVWRGLRALRHPKACLI